MRKAVPKTGQPLFFLRWAGARPDPLLQVWPRFWTPGTACPGIDGLRLARKIPSLGKILSPGVPLGRMNLPWRQGTPGPVRIPVPAALASVRRMQAVRNRDGRIRSSRRRAAPCKRKRFLGRIEISGRENSGGFSALPPPAPPAFRTRRQTGNRIRAGPAGVPIAISRPLFPETVTAGAGHYRIIIGHSGTRGFPFGRRFWHYYK